MLRSEARSASAKVFRQAFILVTLCGCRLVTEDYCFGLLGPSTRERTKRDASGYDPRRLLGGVGGTRSPSKLKATLLPTTWIEKCTAWDNQVGTIVNTWHSAIQDWRWFQSFQETSTTVENDEPSTSFQSLRRTRMPNWTKEKQEMEWQFQARQSKLSHRRRNRSKEILPAGKFHFGFWIEEITNYHEWQSISSNSGLSDSWLSSCCIKIHKPGSLTSDCVLRRYLARTSDAVSSTKLTSEFAPAAS